MCRWPLRGDALPDALTRVVSGAAALVSSSFAHEHGVTPGDTITLESPTGPSSLTVAAVTSAEPVNAVILNRDEYRRRWNDGQVSWAWVVLEAGQERGPVQGAIARALGQKYRLQIRSSAELVAYFASQARQAFSALYLMEGITFLLVLIGVGDTLATGVLERTRELGMMRAVGMRRSQLFAIVLLEGLGIGLLGLVSAAVAGLALGVFWVEVQFPALLGWALDLHFPIRFVLSAFALALALCVVGAIPPSLRAARLPVTTALRSE